MAGHYIDDIPINNKKELESFLDNHPTLNWRALCHITNLYQRYQIEGFGMKSLEPRGSPTNALLNDLSMRKVTVKQLVFWLRQLTTQESRCPSLQSLISSLERSLEPLTITRQPDGIYKQAAGSSVYISCEASPSDGVSYQWFKGKVLLQEKTQSHLHLENITKDDEGHYICRVSLGQTCQFTNWAKIEIIEAPPEIAKPIITTQPCCPAPVILGGMFHLYCDAVGDPAPTFQWCKDNIPINGATSRDFNKANLCHDDEGVYRCVASNTAGQAVSEHVTIEVHKRPHALSDPISGRGSTSSEPTGMPISPRKVSDKVALLIGNKAYWNDLGRLYHPTNDVCDLAGALRSIGFKVVSLVNLTLSEMKFAVKKFYEMLDADMYALFYFAGHGFEVGNLSYLMPVDATPRYLPEENLSASEVITPMQNSQAYLNIVLLDSCRTHPNRNVVNPTKGLEVKKKNVAIVFPCCSKSSVFESESHPNGFFAYYLLKHLGDDTNMCNVFLEVSAGIDRADIIDPQTGQKQIVFQHLTLTEQFSLKAPIDHNLPLRSCERWKEAHELPRSPVQVFKEGDCVVELHFFAEFSNVLLVHARLNGDDCLNTFILEPDIISRSIERHGCVYERLDEKDQTVPRNFPRANCFTQAIRIKDLQRLTGDLTIFLEVQLARKRDSRCVKYTMESKPLYAKITCTSR